MTVQTESEHRRKAAGLVRGRADDRPAPPEVLEKLRCNLLHNLACAIGAYTAGARSGDAAQPPARRRRRCCATEARSVSRRRRSPTAR